MAFSVLLYLKISSSKVMFSNFLSRFSLASFWPWQRSAKPSPPPSLPFSSTAWWIEPPSEGLTAQKFRQKEEKKGEKKEERESRWFRTLNGVSLTLHSMSFRKSLRRITSSIFFLTENCFENTNLSVKYFKAKGKEKLTKYVNEICHERHESIFKSHL